MKIVIKIGSSSLTDGTAALSQPEMIEFARQITQLHKAGHQVVFVCSGAIAAGQEKFPTKDADLATKQMLAAIGQVRLMHLWTQFFEIYNVSIGQILLTHRDLKDNESQKNICNTLQQMALHKILPIINENDTVATEEIRFGDNDNLSARVASLIEADLLILLTDQNGLYTHDPRFHPEAKRIEKIDLIDEKIINCAKGTSSTIGTGGMTTKIEAARHATENGVRVVIASAREKNVLIELAQGTNIGTDFKAKKHANQPATEETGHSS